MATRRGANGVILLLALAVTLVTTARAGTQESAESLRTEASRLAYDLDREQALVLMRRAVQIAPDDPVTHRHLASIVWLQILFMRGALTVDTYLGSFRPRVDLKKPPPDIDAEFRRHVARAVELSERQVTQSPRDPQAHYNLGAAVGLQASYIASVEGRLLAGFSAARRAFDEHEKVLRLDPSRKDAQLVVGTYRYVVSTLSLPVRLMAYVAGFGGGRERGIRMIEEAASPGVENRMDAMFALVLIYNRERRYDDAMRVLEELRRLHPRNRLVVLEAGSTALRANRPQEAERLLTEGMAMLAGDPRPRIPGEEALWHYKRGAARLALGKTEIGLDDLRTATAAGAQSWVQGRARVEIARAALTRGDRETARNEARQAQALCEQGNDPVCVDDAKKLVRNAHGR
jgi:tetratricopeptide (TPR) repeat protein